MREKLDVAVLEELAFALLDHLGESLGSWSSNGSKHAAVGRFCASSLERGKLDMKVT